VHFDDVLHPSVQIVVLACAGAFDVSAFRKTTNQLAHEVTGAARWRELLDAVKDEGDRCSAFVVMLS
jgi:hypothetical protein